MSPLCKLHPTETIQFYCSQSDCHKSLCRRCKDAHVHQEPTPLTALGKRIYDALEIDLQSNWSAVLKTIPTSAQYQSILAETLQSLQSYFVTGELNEEDVVDHVSNYMRVKCLDQIMQEIRSSLEKSLFLCFDQKNISPITFQEKLLVSGQYYFGSQYYRSEKRKLKGKQEGDWSNAQVRDYLGSDPVFPFANESLEIQKLKDSPEIVAWNKELKAIVVVSSKERKLYQAPENMTSFTFSKVSDVLYLFVATRESVIVYNLQKNTDKTVDFQIKVDHREYINGLESEEREPNAEEFQSMPENIISLLVLDSGQKLCSGGCSFVHSKQNKLFILKNDGTAELYEFTQTLEEALSLTLLKWFQMPPNFTDVVVDFLKNLVFGTAQKHLYIYHIGKEDSTSRMILHKTNVQSFQWEGEREMLLVNEIDLYQFKKRTLIRLRTLTGFHQALLTKKGILFVLDNFLQFSPYSSPQQHTKISLPKDIKAVRVAENIAIRDGRQASNQQYSETYGLGDLIENGILAGKYVGHSIKKFQFLNQEEETFIFVNMNNCFDRILKHGEFDDGGFLLTWTNSLVKTQVETHRVFEIDWRM